MHQCYNILSNHLEEDAPVVAVPMAPWDELPYICRVDWSKDTSDTLCQRALMYISRQHPDTTIAYYTDGSSDGQHVAAAYVREEEESVRRLNDSASVMDAEMMAILMAAH